MASSFKPFQQVKVTVEEGDITYTYGGTVICTYEKDGADMVGVSLLNSNGVMYFDENDNLVEDIDA